MSYQRTMITLNEHLTSYADFIIIIIDYFHYLFTFIMLNRLAIFNQMLNLVRLQIITMQNVCLIKAGSEWLFWARKKPAIWKKCHCSCITWLLWLSHLLSCFLPPRFLYWESRGQSERHPEQSATSYTKEKSVFSAITRTKNIIKIKIKRRNSTKKMYLTASFCSVIPVCKIWTKCLR